MSNRRSRSGCRRCRTASRKCDEQKPVCGRCARLSFACDYHPRLVWRKPVALGSEPGITVTTEPPRKRIRRRQSSIDSTGSDFCTKRTGSDLEVIPDHPNDEIRQGGTEEEEAAIFDRCESRTPSLQPASPYDENLFALAPYGAESTGSSGSSSYPTPPSLSLITLPSWKTVIDMSAADFGTFHEFLNHGQRGLHFSTGPNNPFIDELLRNCQRSPTVTAAVLSFQSCQYGDQGSLVKFDKAITRYRRAFSIDDVESIAATGGLICCTSMQLGYSWTCHLPTLTRLAQHAGLTTRRNEGQNASVLLEAFASIDFDAWIIGRQTKPSHIWYRWCMAGSDVEPISCLPRSLLDLIAAASAGLDCSNELIRWSPPTDLWESSAAMHHIWQAYAIATRLFLHQKQNAVLEDDAVVAVLIGCLKQHVTAFGHAAALDPAYHARMAIWPLFVAGVSSTDDSTRSFVRQALADAAMYQHFRSKNVVGAILEEMWARNARGDIVTADMVARERNIEVGLW